MNFIAWASLPELLGTGEVTVLKGKPQLGEGEQDEGYVSETTAECFTV